MKTKVVLLSAFLLGCAGVEVAEEAPSALDCPRYEEGLDGRCQPVEVVDIEERPLSFERAGITLHGTLTVPVTRRAYRPPIFVLAHGSGPNDRDEHAAGALMFNYGAPIPTFKLLAEGLARAGAAVYRYDKRSCFAENSQGRCPNRIADYPDIHGILVDDFIEDHRAAVRAAAAVEGLDADDITVLGHSKGANYVPLVLDEPGVVAGVQLAGVSGPIDEVMVKQYRDLADALEAAGGPEAQVLSLREQADHLEDGLNAIRDGSFEGTAFDGGSVAYWKNWLAITDGVEAAFKAVEKPILLVQGEEDFNVPVAHFDRFQKWAEEAEMGNASFVLLPHVTHNFVKVTPDRRGVEEPLSSEALQAIVDWHRAL